MSGSNLGDWTPEDGLKPSPIAKHKLPLSQDSRGGSGYGHMSIDDMAGLTFAGAIVLVITAVSIVLVAMSWPYCLLVPPFIGASYLVGRFLLR